MVLSLSVLVATLLIHSHILENIQLLLVVLERGGVDIYVGVEVEILIYKPMAKGGQLLPDLDVQSEQRALLGTK